MGQPPMVILGVLTGALGAAARYYGGGIVQRRAATRFPAGTFAVNLTGALAAGLVAGAAAPGSAVRLLTLGFLGGFTTFSTWAVETLVAYGGHTRLRASMEGIVMVAGGIALCALGSTITG